MPQVGLELSVIDVGDRSRGNFGDMDLLNKVPFKRDIVGLRRVKGVSLISPRIVVRTTLKSKLRKRHR